MATLAGSSQITDATNSKELTQINSSNDIRDSEESNQRLDDQQVRFENCEENHLECRSKEDLGKNLSSNYESRQSIASLTHTIQVLSELNEANELPKWRQQVRQVILKNPYFDGIILVLIVLNCAFLAAESPTEPSTSTRNMVVTYSEFFFTFCFAAEMITKIIGLGIYSYSFSYIRDPWNVLDGIIVITGGVTVVLYLFGENQTGVSGVRGFRLIRPLRAVNHMQEVRLIVSSLLRSFPKLVDVLLLYFFFVLLGGIAAVKLWNGSLRNRCVQINDNARDMGSDLERVCAPLLNPGMHGFQCPWGYSCLEVGNPYYGKLSFDNIGISILTIFTAVTMEGWSDTMYYLQDGTTEWAALYFIVVILVGSVFIANLALVMISIVFFETKESEKSISDGEAIAPTLMLEGSISELPEGNIITCTDKVKLNVKRFIQKEYFKRFIAATIVLNTLSMAIEHHNQPDSMTQVLEILNYVFTCILTLELILKLYCYTLREFSRRKFNIFDAVIVVLSLADIIQNLLSGKKTGISVLRALRLARIFKQFKGLWLTTKTILRSLQGVSVLTLLLVLVIFIYGLLGMQLFGGKFCDLEDPREYILSSSDSCVNLPRSNFDHLGIATLTVFQVITGEDWNTVMYNGMRSGSGGGNDLNSLFFITLFVCGNYIVLNLFIAVLINNFGSSQELDQRDTDTLSSNDYTPTSIKSKFMLCCCQSATTEVEEISIKDDKIIHSRDPNHTLIISLLQEIEHGINLDEINDAANLLLNSMPEVISCFNECGWIEGEGFTINYDSISLIDLLLEIVSSQIMLSDAVKEFLNETKCEKKTLCLSDREMELCSSMVRDIISSSSELYELMTNHGWSGEEFSTRFTRKHLTELRRDLIIQLIPADNRSTINQSHIAQFLSQMPSSHQNQDDTSKALFLFPITHPLRRLMFGLVTHRLFELVVIVLILLSTTSLAMNNPRKAPDELLPQILNTVNLVLTICFSIEALLKIIAHGFVLHESSYLRRDGWNRLDFLIVILSLAAIIFASSDVGKFEIFKVMRTLRPLRFINRSPGLKIVVVSLMKSIPALANIFFITTLIFVILGILGVQFFAGSFYACTDKVWGDVTYPLWTDTAAVANAPTTEHACLSYRDSNGISIYKWQNSKDNFDHLGAALLCLFEIATLEGWVSLMHLGQDAVGPHIAPRKDSQPYMAIYFVLVIVIVSFFIINLFIGALIEQYSICKEIYDEQFFVGLSEAQRMWISAQESMLQGTPKMNQKNDMPSWRVKIFFFVLHPFFDIFIAVCIALNVVFMCTEHYNQPSSITIFLVISNYVFIGIFMSEALVKMIAFGIVGYFQDPWNKFDFSIVVISLVSLPVQYLQVLRTLRLTRVIRTASGVRSLLKTFLLSLTNLVNVAGLLSLLFFLYAVLGVDLFGLVSRGNCISDRANFDHFGNAILLLFRMTTGEAWQCIMNDCHVEEPNCDEQLGNCGNPILAKFYFLSFMLLGMYVMLNVFIAVILSGYETVEMENNALLTTDHVASFYNEWEKRDPCDTRLLGICEVPQLLLLSGLPLGIDSDSDSLIADRKRLLTEVGNRCNNYGGKVTYQELICVLADVNILIPARGETDIFAADPTYWDSILETYDKKWKALHPKGFIQNINCTHCGLAKTELAALQIQKVWRGVSVRKNNKASAIEGSSNRKSLSTDNQSKNSIDNEPPALLPCLLPDS